jgi:hypothetical protein
MDLWVPSTNIRALDGWAGNNMAANIQRTMNILGDERETYTRNSTKCHSSWTSAWAAENVYSIDGWFTKLT